MVVTNKSLVFVFVTTSYGITPIRISSEVLVLTFRFFTPNAEVLPQKKEAKDVRSGQKGDIVSQKFGSEQKVTIALPACVNHQRRQVKCN